MSEIRDQLEAVGRAAQGQPAGAGRRSTRANLFFGDDDPRGRPMSKRSLAAIDRKALVDVPQDAGTRPTTRCSRSSGDVDAKALKRAAAPRRSAAGRSTPVPQAGARWRCRPSGHACRCGSSTSRTPRSRRSWSIGPGIAHARPTTTRCA